MTSGEADNETNTNNIMKDEPVRTKEKYFFYVFWFTVAWSNMMWFIRNCITMSEAAEIIRMELAYNVLCASLLYFLKHFVQFLRVIFLLRISHFVDVVEPLYLRDGCEKFYKIHWWPTVKAFYTV